ncbi:MAG: redoxin domain-containing protein, partial [Planctomycetota bacterium]|nr:redoxin domain-containing protein [Planctomycetota bacterium]
MRLSNSRFPRLCVTAMALLLVASVADWSGRVNLIGISGSKTQAEDAAPSAAPAKTVEPKPVVAPRDPALGRRIPSLLLSTPSGEQVGLYDYHDANYLVVTFLNTSCPISNQYLPILNELQAKYKDQKVQFLAINSHAGDSAVAIAKHAQEFGITFPVMCDPQQVAADVFGATSTSETFVLDPQRIVRYRGRIDDRIQHSGKRNVPTRHDLASALDEMLAGKPVSVASTEIAGCKLTRTRRVPPKGEITWSGQVAAIVETKCAGCHHPQTAAPFSLQTYEHATQWAEMIR